MEHGISCDGVVRKLPNAVGLSGVEDEREEEAPRDFR